LNSNGFMIQTRITRNSHNINQKIFLSRDCSFHISVEFSIFKTYYAQETQINYISLIINESEENQGMKAIKSLAIALIFLISSAAFAQFVDVFVEISIDRMPEKERTDLKTLEQMIPFYFENYDWFENSYGIEIPIKISMFPEAVSSSGFERVFTSQIFISTESGDQRFFEKSFKFVYNSNDPLMHTDLIQPLTGTFDFYAYMLIAGELDTYDPLGGNTMYDIARDIATRGQVSERATGWSQRLRELDEILRLRDHRLSKYYYWLSIDLIDQEKTKEVPEAIDKMIEHLDRMFQINARERYTHVFLDVHARDIAEIIRDYGNPPQLEKIIELDPDNEVIYKKLGVAQ
jgi:hypothetical protein